MTSSKRTNNFPGWLLLLGALAAISSLAIDMYLPAFPDMVSNLNTTQGQVERTLASYLLGLALAQMFYGPITDRYGRKKPLIGGLIIFTAASIGCVFTQDIEHLNLWRIVQAFGGAAGMVIPRAVIRDRMGTRDAAKALSLLLLIMGAMPILGPIIGGQLLFLGGWRGIFGLMAAIGVLLLSLTIYTMDETLPADKVTALRVSIIAKNYWGLLTSKQFMCYSLAGGFGMAGLFTYISGSPRVFMEIYDVDPKSFGLYFGLTSGSLIFCSQVSARLLERHSPERLLKYAQTAVVGTSLLSLFITLMGWLTFPLLVMCLMLFMASQGFVNPNTAALALSKQGHRLGVASALFGTVLMLCGASAGATISYWQSPDALPLTGILSLCALLSWLFGRIAMRAT